MKRTILVLLCALVTSVCAGGPLDALKEEWMAFKLEHNKKYESEVADRFHLKVYAENKHKIARHNQRYERGEESFRLKPNRYADMLHHEFVATMNGYNSTARLKGGRGSSFIPPAHVSVPDEVDWREEGAVTAVKSQGKCGSCWAFSTTGSLEGQNWRKTGSLVPLSEQNLLDCTAAHGNKGCRRGRMDNAFSYIRSNGGIDTEASYPYEGVADTCRYNSETVGAEDTGFVNIPPGDEDSLMQAVATVGPVSVAVDASTQTFQFYSDGVYYDESCSPDNLDHAVLVVGYGTDEAEGDYWLVKNSWGTSWGIYGYVKMARNRDNHCGVASAAVYPLV